MLNTMGLGLRLEIERGPDWLFVGVIPPERATAESAPLADAIWSILEQSFIYRVVLELDRAPLLQSYVLGQLVLLAKRIRAHGGLLRLSGVSDDNRDVLRTTRLEALLPSYADRSAAVMCSRPLPR